MYFRYSQDPIGGLCRAAYETVKEVTEVELRLEDDGEDCVPAMIGAPQSWGDLLTGNIHVHALVPEGAFRQDGEFVPIPHVRLDRAIEIWEDKVFDLLWDAGRIDRETIGSMKAWKHSGLIAPVQGATLRAMQSIVLSAHPCALSQYPQPNFLPVSH